MPKISVVTVVFNDAKSLEKTIQSTVNQTYSNIEYIVIDGGSTDGTIDIIKKYESQISYWISEPDKGIYDAMNKGIHWVTGDWVNFMNAGDVFYDVNTVEKVAPLLSDNMLVVYGNTVFDYGSYSSLKPNLDLSEIYYGQVIGHQSAFINTTYHKKNLFSLEYEIGADYNFFLKTYLANKDRFKYIPMNISIFARDGLSHNNIKSTKDIVKVLNNNNKYTFKARFILYLAILKLMIKRILPNWIVRKIHTRKK